MSSSPPVEVATYPTKAEAEFAASVLQTNDIEAYVQAGGTGGEQVGAPTVSGFSVFVETDQLDAAKALLSGVYPEDELIHVPLSERKKEGTSPLSPIPTFILGIVVGALLVGAALAMHSYRKGNFTGTRFYGSVQEGRQGIWDTYESGQLIRRDGDRNLDGKPDMTIYYKDHQIQRAEFDQNFDGKTDMWGNYENGILSETRIDCDFNGVPDEFISYKNEIQAKAEIRPNGATNPTRIVFLENGIKTRQLDEPDAAGQLTREITYDAFGNETSMKKVKAGA